MRTIRWRLAQAAFALFVALAAVHAVAKPPPVVDLQLWRLDCGELWIADLDLFSDTHAYEGQRRRLVASCYLIRHGDRYLLWDTGLAKTMLGQTLAEGDTQNGALATTLVDQLARIGVRAAQVSLIGISHYDFDHTGQAADFPQATLLIGQGDLDALRTPGNEDAKPLAHWLNGGATVEGVRGDRDVFGDGSVVMLDLPGHTPGHHGLLVRLRHRGAVLLSGDVAHFRENLATDGVPSFNVDRARSLASMARFRALARNLHATVVIQHEPRDVTRLPAFPAAAD